MTKKPTLDGFVPRRSPGSMGEYHAGVDRKLPRPVVGQRPTALPRHRELTNPHTQPRPARELVAPHTARASTLSPAQSRSYTGLTRSDVDESLREIDTAPVPEVKPSKRTKKRGGVRPNRRKIIKRVVIAILVAVIAIGGWLAIRAVMASNSIFKGDLFGLVQSVPLKQDANGRSNILIFGTSEDDQEGDHPGALLTDSIMVLSVDQTKKDAYMVSMPRDLWVEYGAPCNAGYQGKINELYNCFSDGEQDKNAGALALAKEAGQVLGLDIQYFTHVNYTAVREAVDAVGGIDVTIETDDPRGILDRNFDWKCNYQCYYVKYENGEKAHMDGEHALAFMRARNASGGYGLSRGNFDREKNQQKVVVGLREKALSVGTLANPAKVTGLIDALGNNLNTSFETNEIRTLMSLASDIETTNIQSISLVDEEEPVLTTGAVGAASVVRPVAGLYDYSGVAAYVQKQLTANPVTKESAKVVVLNGSGVPGAGQTAADKLEEMGFTVAGVDNAPEGEYKNREFYQRDTATTPATRAKLIELYGQPSVGGTEHLGVAEDVDFVVVIGG